MRAWLNRNLNNIIVGSFLVPILLVAFVSISHVTTFYNLSNPISWAIYLSVAVEVAALAALAGISANFGRFIYIPFGIVTIIQFVGNFYYSYSYIDPTSVTFTNWVDMVSGFIEPLGVDPTDLVAHRRILAFLTGGMIPFISLTFAHMLIVYSSKIQSGETSEPKKVSVKDLDKISKEAGKIEAKKTKEKINPTPEEIQKIEEVLVNLEKNPTPEGETIRRLSYTKNG